MHGHSDIPRDLNSFVDKGHIYCTEGLPYRKIGSARNVEVKISKMFLKRIKLMFLKRHFKIFHSNIFIFQPCTGLEKFLKNLHFNDFTKKA